MVIAAVALQRDADRAAAAPEADELAGLLRVFREDRTSGDDMPGDPLGALRQLKDAQPGERPDESRRVDVSGDSGYLWPMRDGVCSSWGNCVPTRSLREGDVSLTIQFGALPDGRYENIVVSGIVRDGIDRVRLTFRDGSSVDVDVRDNSFQRTLSALPIQADWVDENGQPRDRAIPLPQGD